jgi:hypothetical protein
MEEQWTAKVSRLEMQVAAQKAAANGSMDKEDWLREVRLVGGLFRAFEVGEKRLPNVRFLRVKKTFRSGNRH